MVLFTAVIVVYQQERHQQLFEIIHFEEYTRPRCRCCHIYIKRRRKRGTYVCGPLSLVYDEHKAPGALRNGDFIACCGVLQSRLVPTDALAYWQCANSPHCPGPIRCLAAPASAIAFGNCRRSTCWQLSSLENIQHMLRQCGIFAPWNPPSGGLSGSQKLRGKSCRRQRLEVYAHPHLLPIISCRPHLDQSDKLIITDCMAHVLARCIDFPDDIVGGYEQGA